MSPWQRYLADLANPPAAGDDEPIVIQDDCPATDHLTLRQLLRIARHRQQTTTVLRIHNPELEKASA